MYELLPIWPFTPVLVVWCQRHQAGAALELTLGSIAAICALKDGAFNRDWEVYRTLIQLAVQGEMFVIKPAFTALTRVPGVPALVVHSVSVINPSHFEGWGPIVEEAKSMGVPLVLSDLSTHREQCSEDDERSLHADDNAIPTQFLEDVLIDANIQAVSPKRSVLTAAGQRTGVSMSEILGFMFMYRAC